MELYTWQILWGINNKDSMTLWQLSTITSDYTRKRQGLTLYPEQQLKQQLHLLKDEYDTSSEAIRWCYHQVKIQLRWIKEALHCLDTFELLLPILTLVLMVAMMAPLLLLIMFLQDLKINGQLAVRTLNIASLICSLTDQHQNLGIFLPFHLGIQWSINRLQPRWPVTSMTPLSEGLDNQVKRNWRNNYLASHQMTAKRQE